MKILRIFLQLIILGLGGVTLVALIANPTPGMVGGVIFLGILAFLFALTLVLKEQTETRILPNHNRSLKPLGVALLLLGIFGIFFGTSYLIGTEALPNGTGRCRAICQIILLTSQLLGETAARVIAFSLWLSAGLYFCFFGYKAISSKVR